MATQVKKLNAFGDVLEVVWNGNVWESPATHRTHTSASAAMREELEQYLQSCGDDLSDESTQERIDALIEEFLESDDSDAVADDIAIAVDLADVCAPEQVAAMCRLAHAEGRDWREVLDECKANDASERKTMGIE